MSINTKKDAYLQKLQFHKKALLFDELSITMYYCRLVLHLYPDFKEKILNFPPSEYEAEEIYNLSTDRFIDEGRKDKSDEIARIIDESMKSKRLPFFNNKGEAFIDFLSDDKKIKELNRKRFSSLIGEYSSKDDFRQLYFDTLFFDMIIYDLEKIPSPVDSSDNSSFEKLAIDCNDLTNFYFAANRLFWIVDSDSQKMQFTNMLGTAEIAGFNLTASANQLIGYWKAKLERKISSQPGAQATIKAMENRIKRASELVEKKGGLTDSGFEISKLDFRKSILKAFDLIVVSAPSMYKYRRKISALLSEKHGKEIELILTKK